MHSHTQSGGEINTTSSVPKAVSVDLVFFFVLQRRHQVEGDTTEDKGHIKKEKTFELGEDLAKSLSNSLIVYKRTQIPATNRNT